MSSVQHPDIYCCPITQDLMEDPVIDNEGVSYERIAIEQWLIDHKTSPVTKQPLQLKDLRPNRALREAIEQYRFGKPQVQTPQTNDQPLTKKIKLEVPAEPVTVSVEASQDFMTIIVDPGMRDQRVPTDVCCVVDISGSMSTDASIKNDKGEKESYGLSQLDVVKHAVKTVIHTLGPHDRIAVVAFDQVAHTVLSLTQMTSDGRMRALTAVENMSLGGTTNLWDGLQTGLELLRTSSTLGKNKAVMLLTDGMPNVTPPRGELGALKNYLDSHQFSATINTFGFGYSLDSQLLSKLAEAGQGSYSFIPDSSMVGTIFVNSLANILTTSMTNSVLRVEFLNGCRMRGGPVGLTNFDRTSWGVQVNLGNMRLGQDRTVVIPMEALPNVMSGTPYANVQLNYYDCLNGTQSEIKLEQISNRCPEIDQMVEIFRTEYVEKVMEAFHLMQNGSHIQAQNLIIGLVQRIKQSLVSQDARVIGLIGDLEGQIKEALSRKEWFDRWGIHYLPSLIGAHQLQLCNNFKDPGVQQYGGPLFKKVQDEADGIFMKLPPPKPSKPVVQQTSSYGGSSTSYSSYRSLSSMSTYHNSGNPCFAHDCTVVLEDGTTTQIKNLKKGDRVLSTGGKYVTIRCVIETHCASGKSQLVKFQDGLRITPYHPMKWNNEWVFPCLIGDVVEEECPAIFSFVLEEGSSLMINGIECVSLGHGLEENEIVKHEYFGTEKVVQDLMRSPTWENGHVNLESGCMIRDPVTDRVTGLKILTTE